MAAGGDRYADNAAGVLGRSSNAADIFFQALVESHWKNTVGEDVLNCTKN